MDIRWFMFLVKRLVKYRLFGVKRFSRRVPRKGQQILACCPNDEVKTVAYCSVWEDTIEYTDGTTDSLTHCGWQLIR